MLDKQKIKEAILKNRALLQQNKVKSIALFGSFARNEQTSNSDIDLLVEFGEPSYDNYINLVFSLENVLKKAVTVVTPQGLSPYVRPYVLKEAEKIEG